MDAGADIRAILKSAKDQLKNKNYKEVLRLCKSIIDKDKENYFAWVFTGAAAQEQGSKEQALAAFQRAIQSSPNQAPAWQVHIVLSSSYSSLPLITFNHSRSTSNETTTNKKGLAQLYETKGPQSELTSVYGELRKIFQTCVLGFSYSIFFLSFCILKLIDRFLVNCIVIRKSTANIRSSTRTTWPISPSSAK